MGSIKKGETLNPASPFIDQFILLLIFTFILDLQKFKI